MHINYVRGFKENRLGRLGIIFLALILSIAFLAPVLTAYSPRQVSENILQPPSQKHWLGTNDLGQDIWSRVIFGARTSFITALSVGILTVTLAVFIGCSAALLRGIYERFVLRLIDIFLIIPNILLLLLTAAYLRPGPVTMVIVLSIFNWPGCARIIRAQTLTLQEKSHIKAAKTFGAGTFYILVKHIIPDLGPILASSFIAHARRAVFMEAGLAFLGISDPLLISWGTIINRALQYSYLNNWYWLLPPALGLSLTVMAFSFLGYTLEEILNPRLKVGKNAGD